MGFLQTLQEKAGVGDLTALYISLMVGFKEIEPPFPRGVQ